MGFILPHILPNASSKEAAYYWSQVSKWQFTLSFLPILQHLYSHQFVTSGKEN